MSRETLVHVVAQGEHLHEIAVRYCTEAATIWNLPNNKPLKVRGRTPEQLCAGDVLYVPVTKRKFMPITVGTTNTFAATVPTTHVTVHVVGDNGKGIANEPYDVPCLGVKGITDADGAIHLKKVPLLLKLVHVHLVNMDLTLSVGVGHLDPVTTPTGKAQRLGHLGYLTWDGTTVARDRLAHAFAAFMGRVVPNAKSDAEVETALVKAHRS